MTAPAPAILKKRAARPARDQSVRGTYEHVRREQLIAMMARTRWRILSTELIPDLYRATGSASKSGVLAVIDMHTAGRVVGPGGDKLKIQATEVLQWSPNLTTGDFAKILGLSKRQCLKAVTWCLKQGLIERRGQTGSARVQYRINTAALHRAPNRAEPQEPVIAFPESSDISSLDLLDDSRRIEEPAGSEQAKETGMTCGTSVPHTLAVIVPSGAGPKSVASFDTLRGKRYLRFVNELTEDASITASLSPRGDVVFGLSPAAPRSGAEESAAAEAFDDSQSSQDCRIRSGEDWAALKAGLKDLGLPIGEVLAERLVRLMPSGCSVQRALQLVRERVERPSAKPFAVAILPKFFAEDVAQRWQEEPLERPAGNASDFARRYQEKQDRLKNG